MSGESGGDVVPREDGAIAPFREVCAGAGKGAGVALEEVDPLDSGSEAEGLGGEKAPARAEIGDFSAQVRREVGDEKLRARVDFAVAENSGPRRVAGSGNGAWLAEGPPLLEERLIPGAVVGRVEDARFVFLDRVHRSGGAGEFLFEAARAGRVRQGRDEGAAGLEVIAGQGEGGEDFVTRFSG